MKTLHCATRYGRLFPLVVGFLLWSALLSILHAEYKYPIGIPKAWIEPDVEAPARPDPWIAEIPGYYYVSWTSGSDSGRSYGTPALPRKTIPSMIPAGSRVEVSGVYGQTGTLFITFAGNGAPWEAGKNGPGWLVGTQGDRASFAGSIYYVGAYGCVENVDNLAGHKSTSINSPTKGKGRIANHFLIRRSEFKGTGSSSDSSGFVINGNADSDGVGTDIIFYNNEVHHFGVSTPADLEPEDSKDPDFIAIILTDNVERIWLLDNHLHHMSGSAIQMGANTGTVPLISHVYAGRNECHHLWSTGMAAKTSQYIVYSQNHIYDVLEAPGGPSKGIAGQYGATDQWLLFNRIHDCAHGILRVSGNKVTKKLFAIGNVIYDINTEGETPNNTGYGQSGIGLWGVDEAYIVGNTMWNVPNGIITPAAQLIYMENNIIANMTSVTGYHFLGDLTGSGKDIRFRNNQFWQEGGNVNINMPGEKVMSVSMLDRSAYGKGNKTGDPKFVDALEGDFTLKSNSPAIDSALASKSLQLDVYAKYRADFGVDISLDANGLPRPLGNGWDIGALEFTADGTGGDPENQDVSVPKGLKAAAPPSKE